MKLRFDVDQAEAFRQGVDCPKSNAFVEVNPEDLDQDERNLIADRLNGIDILELRHDSSGKREIIPYLNAPGYQRVKAKLPTLEALIAAIRENEANLQAEEVKMQQAKGFADAALHHAESMNKRDTEL